MEEHSKFEVIALGIVFDPIEKKVLIGRRQNDPTIPELTWCFPGGRIEIGEDIDNALKRHVKAKTGYEVKNIGTFFSKTYEEKENLISIFFLTKVYEGKEKAGEKMEELKWVSPTELENYFTTSFHPKLKEFLLELI
jgi:8-oxo-dGTP diphosphatase